MKIFKPHSLEQALKMKADNPGAELLAGGTDLLPSWNAGNARPDAVLLLSGLDELRGIGLVNDKVEIGACTTHSSIASSALIERHVPALSAAAAGVGAPAVRNMGTIGGNIVCPSPAADLPPALMVYQAEAVVASTEGERVVPFEDFFLDYRKVDLGDHEILTKVRINVPPKGSVSYYRKVGSRKAQTLAKVSLAAWACLEGDRVTDCKLAAGSVGPTVVRLRAAEEISKSWSKSNAVKVAEEAGGEAYRAVSPIDDLRSTAEYRRFALAGLVKEFILGLA